VHGGTIRPFASGSAWSAIVCVKRR
jgi:hypothetical protein